MKPLLVILLALGGASCTTLENRRDLYRSPAEGYEPFFAHPPPTRGPASGPAGRVVVPGEGAVQETHGVITFPEEPGLPQEEGR